MKRRSRKGRRNDWRRGEKEARERGRRRRRSRGKMVGEGRHIKGMVEMGGKEEGRKVGGSSGRWR
jgi:hypothetical protein